MTITPASESSAFQDDDPIFKSEQNHLSYVYNKLEEMSACITKKLDHIAQEAANDKRVLCDDIAPNFSSAADTLETYADYALVNSVIDSYNLAQRVESEKLEHICVLLEQPYFAKIVLAFESADEPKELYLGTVGVSDEQYRRLVVDWRSPVAEVYYNQEMGQTSYRAHGRSIKVDLQLRRQFSLSRNSLHAYFDTRVAIQDTLLLDSLSKHRSAKMQDITATIQKEQNAIIRHEDVPALLVSGIAGSGKTSVLMQRIAYLFYTLRDSLDPRQVFLITPNPVFQSYVDHVLPSLGEHNPRLLTWAAFLEQLLPKNRLGGRMDVSYDDLIRLEQACEQLVLEQYDFQEVRCKGECFLSAGYIFNVANRFADIVAGPRKITLIREALIKRFEKRLTQIASSDAVIDELLGLSPDDQLRLFHETFDVYDEDEARSFARAYVEQRYADVRRAIVEDEWLRIDRIGMRLLGVESLTSLEWLYVKMVITGLGNSQARYVMIDEVQDYTAAQLAIVARYFRCAHILLLGDTNQAINEGSASVDEMQRIFAPETGQLEQCFLMTSYRSSPEITNLFASLLEDTQRIQISSIQREGVLPVLYQCCNEGDYNNLLNTLIDQAAQEKGLSALIVAHKKDLYRLRKRLGNRIVPCIDEAGEIPEQGVVVTTLKLAKGLEFDHVIIADVSNRSFPHTELARRRLYTTISRATQKLTMLYEGRITSYLENSSFIDYQ